MSAESPPTTAAPTSPVLEMHQTTSVLTVRATESAIEEVIPPEQRPPRTVGPRGYWKVYRHYVHPPTHAVCILRILVGSNNAEPVFSFEIGRTSSDGKVVHFNQWRRDDKANEFAFMNSFALVVGGLVARAEDAVRRYLAANYYENIAKRPMPEGFLEPKPRPKPKPRLKPGAKSQGQRRQKPTPARPRVQRPEVQQPVVQRVTPATPKPPPKQQSGPAPRQRQKIAPPVPRAEAAPQGPQGWGWMQSEEKRGRPRGPQTPRADQDLKSR